MLSVSLKTLHPDAVLPQAQTEGAGAVDLHSVDAFVIEPRKWALVRTGLAMEIPPGFAGLVCPRSGLANKHGVTVLNAPGIIDADYRGDVGVILINLGERPFEIKVGDRVAQLMICRPEQVRFFATGGTLSTTERGTGGFGSTGVSL